jgi:nucleoside-diphosphate-sugar epimerase
MKRIAITGATGFLGNRTAKMLTEAGYEVTALGRNILAGRLLERDGIRFVRCEVSDVARMKEAFRKQDAVVHCAALTSAWGKWEDFHATNVIGTRNVVQAVQGSSVQRWIHLSSGSIYMNGSHRLGVRETDPLPAKGIDFYSESKRLAEREADAFSVIPVITLRPLGVFGPGDRQWMPRIARMGKIFRRIPQIDGGGNTIDLTYVDNVVDAIIASLRAGSGALGNKYNISNGEPVDCYSTFDWILTQLGYYTRPFPMTRDRALLIAGFLESVHRAILPRFEPLLTRYAVHALAESRTVNIDAARRDLEYRAKVSLREGLRRAVDDYRARR